MKRLVLICCTAVLACCSTASALPVKVGSNTKAAYERMEGALFSEYNGEGSQGFEWSGFRTGYEKQLKMHLGNRWEPVELLVSCKGASCVGRIVAEATDTTALVDHSTFRGRKGTYHETGWSEP